MRALGLWFVLVGLVGLGACKQAKEPTPASELLAKVRDLSAKACACTDRACIEPLMKEWNSLTTAIGDGGKVSGGTFTEEQVEGLATEDERFMKCADKFASPAPADSNATAGSNANAGSNAGAGSNANANAPAGSNANAGSSANTGSNATAGSAN